MSFKTIEWKNDRVLILDQRKLPTEKTYINCSTHNEVAEAISSMAIRGAPAIGIAAAMGFALGAREKAGARTRKSFVKETETIRRTLGETRPTAVNLFWALERMERIISGNPEASPAILCRLLKEEAVNIYREDLELCRRIGENGEVLVENGSTIMTHCNAGGLATAGFGTALGVVRAARNAGKNISVISPETRPLFQGSRLTAWELSEDNIPVTVITDTMAGYVMREGAVDAIIVGADRIAANGDVANKIGTYQISVLARHHGIPFYVAAPWSTVDMQCKSGEGISIEQRPCGEVYQVGRKRVAAKGADFINPAFDITPAPNVDCIITDRGIVNPVCRREIENLDRN